ncbi:bifunctional allantoicase/(S)-ureidoglycine aminohydrolase [Roseospira visakhapatnamensis]|uniref:(S)-ureidoglycine aminohydrolase n=1 Tax=Roseospira visakhapatnamensis TaxID=390880 RepID=A0A7W6RFS7_9PROT|nr:bifunctional allantoicase/(S)-ureidoglycine aminohydrolase [Roseospira visakhapatnamensis]MBB4267761.1 (S)-ureidoglycine aminohydrolase [Roseospira visakhapatnamensis]
MTNETRRAGPYHAPRGGLPHQTQLMTDRAVFTEAYAVIPRGTLRDIVTSAFPFWDDTRAWVLARPMTGFAETFAQAIVEIGPGGGSETPEPEAAVEGILFVLDGTVSVTLGPNGQAPHDLGPGGYAYLPPGCGWTIRNRAGGTARLHWIRKRYQPVAGLDHPDPLVTNETLIPPSPMPGTGGGWATTHFVDPADMRHDMHVTIVTMDPGACIPFAETHVMEHGLYVLEGKAVYHLNRDWIEVEAGDFMWLRAFCPQACYAGGPGRFRYLLYKDVNRHATFPAWVR